MLLGQLQENYYSIIVYIDEATLYQSGSCTVSIIEFSSTSSIVIYQIFSDTYYNIQIFTFNIYNSLSKSSGSLNITP